MDRANVRRQDDVDVSHGDADPDHSHGLVHRVKMALSALSFWSAIALAGVYLPLLSVAEKGSTTVGLLLGVLGLHAIALVAGHPYCREIG